LTSNKANLFSYDINLRKTGIPNNAYQAIIKENRALRIKDLEAVGLNRMSKQIARQRDRIRQMRVYEQMIMQGKAGGGTISTIELAKSLNAIAQEKGIISPKADISLGIHKQFLKESFSSGTNKNLNRRLIHSIEQIKAGNVPKGLGKWLEAWKEPTALKIEQEARAILNVRKKLTSSYGAQLFSGTMLKTNYASFRNEMLTAKSSQGFRLGEYGLSSAEIFLQAEAKAGIKVSKLNKLAGKLPEGLGRYAAIIGGVAAAGYLIGKTAGISGKDDDYNTIEGLNHGWFGQSRNHITDFGSGFNMNRINRVSAALGDPLIAEAINKDKDRLQQKSQVGEINRLDLMHFGDQSTLEGLNRRRKQLREVKLSQYNVIVDDADTLVLNKKGSSEPAVVIRMSGIDAPETSHANDPLVSYRVGQEQPLGQAATSRLKEILGNKEDLRLIVDPTQKSYGRYLGVIFKGNENINLKLAEEGYVSSLEFGPKHKDAVDRATFMAAGDKAEREGLGIWGHDFFKDWKAFSAGAGRDITFNSLTDLLRLGRNKYLAAGAAEMWEDGYNQEESYRQGALYQITNQFSGKGGSYNSISAMPHGWFGKQRRQTTEFGSGFKGSLGTPHEDPTPTAWGGLATSAGLFGTSRFLWNKEVNFLGKTFDLNKFSYMGVSPEVLGRKNAAYKDFAYNALRRLELGLGGIPKAFSLSTIMSPSILKDMTVEIDLGTKPFDPVGDQLKKVSNRTFKQSVGYGYEQYFMELTGKNKKTFGIGQGMDFERFTKARFEGGKLYGITGTGQKEILLEEARAYQAIHDKNISTSKTQFTKSYEHIFNIAGVGREHEILIAGGKTKRQAAFRAAHAYGHETLSKYLRLVDDPVKAFRDLFPNLKTGGITEAVHSITKRFPKFGVGGEKQLIGTLPQLLARHAAKALPLLIGLPAIFGTLNWMTRQIAPEDSVAGKAGITGVLAEGARLAHMTYAEVSEVSGLTEVRKYAEERAPGLTGLKPWLGFTLSGMITGTALGMGAGIFEEARASSGVARYEAMIKSKTIQQSMASGLRKIPTMGGKYTRALRWGKYGGLAMAALAAPFLLFGLGSEKSVAELNEEYLNGKEVAIKKARWWEFGTTPWEGSKTDYYRPNWYNRILDRPTDKSIYNGEDISPIGKFVRNLADPYWLEKMHYEDRPYPIAGSSGEDLGLFGAAYEWTVGRVMKPPVLMHPEIFEGEHRGDHLHGQSGKYAPSKNIAGGLPPEDTVTPYSAAEQLKQQYYTTYEAVGLRGFVASAIKQAVTGEQDVFEHTPILQSSADIDSTRRKFWDLNLGGFLGMTEPIRRFIPKRPYTTEYVNPIANDMPDWMPGADYYKNFKEGDPFTKIQEGEYRLPGRGYAARYKELEGVNPADYPLIHKYKILADIAPYSREFREARKELEEHNPTDYELEIFQRTEEQLEDKRKRKTFRDEVYDQSVLGRYGAALVDIARANPLEQLSPIAPAHKLLPPSSAMTDYEETIYGKEFKLWQRPIDDFVKPFITTVGNLVGIDRIPDTVRDARQIETYFDQLEYVKNKRLEMMANGRGAEGRAKSYHNKAGGTLAGADVYSNEFRLMAALPKREKVYFQQFKGAAPEDKAHLLEIMPDSMKDLYIAQWDKTLLKDMSEGKLDITQREGQDLEKEVFNRMATIRARRQAEGEALQSSDKLPGEDWIGWRADVDLEDIKLKYLIDTGREYHYYDLWDDRLRGLRRKPYLEESLEGIEPFQPLAENVTYEEVYKQAVQAGIRNPQIIQRESVGPTISYDLEYDRDNEIYQELRTMGKII
jgi:endonuclease YncB( thermonuclease family)